MLYKEAMRQFNTDDTVCILVKTIDGVKALSESNFEGGCCGCCQECTVHDNLEVIRVVDLNDMQVLYETN